MKTNLNISQFEDFCQGVSHFHQNLKITETSLFYSIHQENTCKSCLSSNFIILTDFHSLHGMKTNFKFSEFSRVLQRSEYAIQVNI